MARKSTVSAIPSSAGKYDDWQVKDALRTLTQAEEIRADKRMMAKVKTEAAKMTAAVKKATG